MNLKPRTCASSAPGRVDATDIDTALASVQICGSCADNERRLINHALFRRLYLADNRITDHEPPDDARCARVTPAPPATTPQGTRTPK